MSAELMNLLAERLGAHDKFDKRREAVAAALDHRSPLIHPA